MAELYANATEFAASITLTAGVDADDVSLAVSAAAPVSLRGGTSRWRIDNELVVATIPADGVSPWVVQRAAEGSVAAAHLVGAVVRHVVTAAMGAAVADHAVRLPAVESTQVLLAAHTTLDDATNNTTVVNELIQTLSAAATASKPAILRFGRGVLRTTGIKPAKNVHIYAWGCLIKKIGQDGTPQQNSLVRCLETAVSGSYDTGLYSNIKIRGGVWDSNGYSCPAAIFRMHFTEGLDLAGLEIVSHTNSIWAMTLGGRDGVIRNCKLRGGTLVFQDGIHVSHGQNWIVRDNDVECGDDALAAGIGSSDSYLAAEHANGTLEPMDNIRFIDNRVKSWRGHALRVYTYAGDIDPVWRITNILERGTTGQAGILRNGGVMLEGRLGADGLPQIDRVDIDLGRSLVVGSTNHDDVGAYGILSQTASNVTVRNAPVDIVEYARSVASVTTTNASAALTAPAGSFRPALAIANVVTTNGSREITAPPGSFDAARDENRPITGAGIPATCTIASVESATEATLLFAATASATITATLGSDAGRSIKGAGIPHNTTLSAVASDTAATLSQNATASATVTTTVGAVLGFDLAKVYDSPDFELGGLKARSLRKRFGVDVRRSSRFKLTDYKLPMDAHGLQAPVRVEDCPDLDIGRGFPSNIHNGVPAVLFVGTLSSGRIHHMKPTPAVGAVVTAINAAASTFTALTIDHNDFSAVEEGVSASLLTSPNVIVKNNRGLADENAIESGLPGIVAPDALDGYGSAAALVAGRGSFARFAAPRTLHVVSIAFEVTTAASVGDAAEVALYDGDGARIITSGAVTGKLNSTGVKTVPLVATLPPGVYYAALLCPTIGGTPASIVQATAANVLQMQAFGATAPNVIACHMTGLASLPATIVPVFAASTVALLPVRES